MEYLTDAGGTADQQRLHHGHAELARAALKAVTFMRSLITSGVSPAAVTTFQEPQAMNTFGGGQRRVPAQLGLRLQLPPPLRPAAASSPRARSAWRRCRPSRASPTPATPTSAAGTCTSTRTASTSAPDLTFIQWLSSPAAQDILSEQYGFISTVTGRADARPRSSPRTRCSPSCRRPGWSRGPPARPSTRRCRTAIYQNVNGALAGSASPSAAASAMQSAASTALVQHIQRRAVTVRRAPGREAIRSRPPAVARAVGWQHPATHLGSTYPAAGREE